MFSKATMFSGGSHWAMGTFSSCARPKNARKKELTLGLGIVRLEGFCLAQRPAPGAYPTFTIGAIFLEVEISDASDFETTVHVTSDVVGGHYVLRATGPSVPNVLAAVLLDVRDRMRKPPHAYFEWSQKAPGQNVLPHPSFAPL